jgi:hypothetical protein
MKITTESLARLGGAKFTAESVCKVFGFMQAQCEAIGANSTQFSFDFQKPEDVVVPGDLIPVLTLSLRPATPNAPKPEETVDLREAPMPGPAASPV